MRTGVFAVTYSARPLYPCYYPPSPWSLLALASLVIFTPRAYDLVLFPMSSISFYYASLFAMLAIICLRQVTTKRFMLALIFAGLATLTNASVQLAMLMGLAYLLYQWLFSREKIAIYCFGWLVFSCLLAALLFIVKDDSAMPQAFITQAENIGATPMHYLKFFLALLGSTLSFHSTALSIAMGAGLLVLVLLLCLEKLLKAKVDAAVFISFFFIGCAAAISYGRGPYVTVDYALTSRYSYQSTFLIFSISSSVATQSHSKLSLTTAFACQNINS